MTQDKVDDGEVLEDMQHSDNVHGNGRRRFG